MRNELDVLPVSGAIGAEIRGVDLRRIDDEIFAKIREVFVEHSVIFLRDQILTPEEQKAFTRRFGAFSEIPFIETMKEHPEIIAVIKEADEGTKFNFGGNWHSDFSFLKRPPLGSVLYAKELPPFGGDTMWANMYRAYETLSEAMRAMLDPLKVVHSGKRSYTLSSELRSMKTNHDSRAETETEHPLVRTHPESKRRCLFINGAYALRFSGMTEAESAPLLGFLQQHATRPGWGV